MVDMMDIFMDPEKHGYKVCDHCNGYGSSLHEEMERCSKCGGKGLVKNNSKKEKANESGN